MNSQAPSPAGTIRIVLYASRHAAAFRDLNMAWINELFHAEQKDFETLDAPRESILDKGGAILIAEDGETAVGCCALIPYGDDGALELAKMAVAETHRGRGIGRMLLLHAIAAARSTGAPKLYLESNTKLLPAMRLYESVGFHRIPQSTSSHYSRVDVVMELDLRS